jgi:hypothetical protein
MYDDRAGDVNLRLQSLGLCYVDDVSGNRVEDFRSRLNVLSIKDNANYG